MRSLLRLPFRQSNVGFLHVLEAGVVGLFFVQALRFLVGTAYARVASASLYPALNPALIDPITPGVTEPATVSNEISILVYLLALPLAALLLGRFAYFLVVGAIVTAVGRYLMMGETDVSSIVAAGIAVGGGLFYIAVLTRHRARVLPFMFILAIGLDQLYRAAGDTLDVSWDQDYASVQLILSIGVVALALVTAFAYSRRRAKEEGRSVSPDIGLMSVWGGVGFGAILFLQLSLLALPNAIGARAKMDYTLLVPMVMVATLLPLVPQLRARARWFIGLFDRGVRGWSWMLLTVLLLVLGIRLEGIPAGVALVLAQFMISMMWWWLTRPKAQKERNFTGLWLVLGIWVFILLVVFDTFTYEYAFVRDFAEEFDFLNPIVPPLLRGFRGMGLAVILLSAFLAVMPMVQMRHRIAWTREGLGHWWASLGTAAIVFGLSAGASYLARPPVIQGVTNPQDIRVGTYNIHAGYNEFYDYDLEDIALTIQFSGANVVLLQEIEAGRMTSYGVDQPLWLARRLGMDVRFYPTNEGLQGLAVLSNIQIVYDDGVLLDSIGLQTGLQRVQVWPDITVYNTWLDPLLHTGIGVELATQEEDQQNQLTQIFGILAAHYPYEGLLQHTRTIVGGTFNNIPTSDLIRRMSANGLFVDAFADEPLEMAATFRRTNAMSRLDYLWTTSEGNLSVLVPSVIDPVSGGHVDAHPSDHRMAVIWVELTE